MTRHLRTAFVVFAFYFAAAPHDARAESELETSGEFTTGAVVKEFKHGESETAVRFKVKTKRKEKARIVAEVQGSNLEREVKVREAYLDQKFSDDRQLLVGYNKKILGLEYDLSDAERLPIRRTLIYRKLETFAYVGRETILRYEQKAAEHSGDPEVTVSLGYADSLDANLTAGWKEEVSPSWWLGAWALVQSDKIVDSRQVVWATFLSLLRMNDAEHWEVELAAGQDPFESEFSKAFGDGRNFHYAGAKALFGYAIGIGNETAWEPFVAASILKHDVRTPRYQSLEGLLGINFHLSRALGIAFNIDLVATNSRVDADDYTYNDSTAALEVKYVF